MANSRLLTTIPVYEVEESGRFTHTHGATIEKQECGTIVGAGVPASPFKIELSPLYVRVPELISICECLLADGADHDMWDRLEAVVQQMRQKVQ